MISRDDEGGLVAILRNGLNQFPERFDIAIHVIGRLQVKIVASLVSPFVGFSVTEEEHSRLLFFDVRQGRLLHERIQDQVIPKGGRVLQQ